jgi:hypothetical protein
MKPLIAIAIVVAALFVGWKMLDYWDQTAQERESKRQAANTQIDPRSLEGVPYQLEGPLDEAYKKGATGLKDWIEKAKRSPQIKDPRLAWIELDYALKVAPSNPLEAKRVFAGVRDRTTPQSPIYPRVKALEKTME